MYILSRQNCFESFSYKKCDNRKSEKWYSYASER